MSRHQYDLIQCMKQPGNKIGKICANCDGRCPICDSFVKPKEKVRICQDCSQGNQINKCILCNSNLDNNSTNPGMNDDGSDAYYCLECVRLEKHREGCPRILNIGSSKSDMIFNKKKVQGGNKLERLTN